MTGINGFKIFNEAGLNMMGDSAYNDSTYRVNGAVAGVAPLAVHNKLYRQLSIMAAAIAQVYANHNIDMSDANFDNLVTALTKGMCWNLWQPKKAYTKGDVCYGTNAPSWGLIECSQSGVSGDTEPVWGTDKAIEISDGSAKWKLRDIKSGSSGGEQIGSVKPWLGKAAPPGWLAIDAGAIVSRAAYPDFWAWVQANAPLISEAEWLAQAAVQSSVGYYSTGDGSTTFRLPRIVDFVRGSDVNRAPGTWQNDEFKDHQHAMASDGYLVNPGSVRAVLTTTGTQASTNHTGGVETRPKSISMLWCVKAFDAPVNQGLIDITALANTAANKQNALAYIKLWDEKPYNTPGGTFTTGAWRTRDLNQKQVFGISFDAVTLTNNQFVLPAGTYIISSSVPTRDVNTHKARLQNITDSSTVLIGTSEYSSPGGAGANRSYISGVFTIAATKTFELQHYCGTTVSTYGFGQAASISGVSEIYSQIEIWKVG